MYNAILVNGDSYSAGSIDLVWADHLSKILNLPVYNLAFPGSSNSRIVRSTLEFLLDLPHQIRPLVIIGWSFVRRQEVWYYGNSKDIDSMFPEKESRLITLDALLSNNLASLEQKNLIQPDKEVHKTLIDFWTNQWLLTQALEKKNIPYWFFSAADNTDCAVECFPYINGMSMVKELVVNPRIYKINEFCIPWWGRCNDKDVAATGHLSAQGHRDFAKFIAEQIKNIC